MPSSRLPSARRRRALAITLAAVALLAVVAVAQGAHWPFYGGDQGRSGYQPVDEGGLPITQVHANTGATEQNVQNSIITTGGPLADRLYAFGTEATGTATPTGQVHLQDLETGTAGAARPEPGTNVDDGADDEDTFRGLNTPGNANDHDGVEGQGVAFADATPAGQAPAQLYVVHNDDNQDGTNDISIAQIEASNGVERQDVAIPNTHLFTVASSPVLGPERTVGNNTERDLFFVAHRAFVDRTPEGCGDIPPQTPCGVDTTESTRLYKVTITNPAAVGAQIDAANSESVEQLGLNPLASPSLANLTTTEVTGGTATTKTELYVIQGASNGRVFTYEADSLDPGPAADLPNNGDAQTVSAPVEEDGQPPASASALFVAVAQNPDETQVYRLRVNAVANGTDTLVPATTGDANTPTGTSALLAGTPAAALAVEGTGDGDHVVVTTSRNLYVLDADDLRAGTRLSFADDRTPGGTGFSRNTAAISGDLAFVSEDDGTPLVIRLSDAQPVADDQFQEYPAHLTSTSALGQPSISSRFVQYATNAGTFVYRMSQPSLAVGDVEIVEGDSGTRTATFTVTLSEPAEETVTVNYTTSPTGTNPATEGTDYQDATGTLTFAPGQTTRTIPVTINGDTTNEQDETFQVTLSSASGATVSDATGIGTIADDDTGQPNPPGIAITDASIAEGDTGTRELTFTVSLSSAAAQTVTVNWSTADDTATAGTDYVAEGSTVTFTPGDTSETITVTVNGDTADESLERFLVNLTMPTANATIADAQGVGSIADDDEPTPGGIGISDASIGEGDDGTQELTFTVSLSAASATPVTVKYATAAGTAEAGSDYQAENGTVTFTAGDTSETVTVTVSGDTDDEELEQFFVNLTDAAGATIADAQGVGSIVDDDEPTPAAPDAPPAPATLSIDDVSVTETDGPGQVTFTVRLSRAAATTVTADYGSVPGAATTPADFGSVAGQLTFAAGDTTKTITVPIAGDDVTEGVETFAVGITRPSGAVIGDGAGIGTIIDDDVQVRVVEPARVNARGLTARTTPSHDRDLPFRFRTTGRLLLPAGVPASSACIGTVSVQIKRGSNTISTRRAEVRSDCRYSSSVTFDDRERLGRGSKRLKVTVRFLGNPRLNRVTGTPRYVRIG